MLPQRQDELLVGLDTPDPGLANPHLASPEHDLAAVEPVPKGRALLLGLVPRSSFLNLPDLPVGRSRRQLSTVTGTSPFSN